MHVGMSVVFRYTGLPLDEAKRNMTLFAKEVMPELQKLPPLRTRREVA